MRLNDIMQMIVIATPEVRSYYTYEKSMLRNSQERTQVFHFH